MKLYNNVIIPDIGLGTWLTPNDKVASVVANAIKIGYRHIDTAQAYENEEGVGKGIKESGIKREDIFVTTKVAAEIKDYKLAKKSIDESLKKLGLDYVDLLLIHCPVPWDEYGSGRYNYFKENVEVWKALEETYIEGKAKSIGVSNFQISDLENIFKNCKIMPMVNQVYASPTQVPFELVNYCKDHNIVFEAYSPLSHGKAKDNKLIIDIAIKNNKSFSQICLKYLLTKDLVVLPKASSYDHLKENFDLDFDLDKEDIKLIDDNN